MSQPAAIINYAMAPEMRNPVVEYMKHNPFSLAIDGGSDTGTKSMYPLVVRIFDYNKGEVSSKFWHMCLVSDCSAIGIFLQVSAAFDLYDITGLPNGISIPIPIPFPQDFCGNSHRIPTGLLLEFP